MIKNNRIKENGKIIVVASLGGKFQIIQECNPDLYQRLQAWESWGYKELNALEEECVADHKDPERAKLWSPWVYFTSKLMVNLWVSVFAKDPRVTEKGIQEYAMCPGFCETSMMTGSAYQGVAPRTAEQGAQSPV